MSDIQVLCSECMEVDGCQIIGIISFVRGVVLEGGGVEIVLEELCV